MGEFKKNMYANMPLSKISSMITKPYYGSLLHKMQHSPVKKNFAVLILLEKNTNCTQQFISCALQIDKVSMVKIIDDLSKKGLVNRTQNSKDRREYFIELTPKAHKILPEIHNSINELNIEAFKGFKPKEIETFYKSLYKVIKNVEDLPASHTLVFKIKKKLTKTI